MAELIPRLECSFEEFQWRHIDTRFGARRLRHSMRMPVAFILIRILWLLQIAKMR